MDYSRLLYVLEKVKRACSSGYGVYHAGATDGSDDEMLCLLELKRAGLIRVAVEEPEHTLWVLND